MEKVYLTKCLFSPPIFPQELDFISALPDGYITMVGDFSLEREETASAPDPHRPHKPRPVDLGRVDQHAGIRMDGPEGVLEAIMKGWMTLGLTIIWHASRVFVLEGVLIESGTHDELMKRRQSLPELYFPFNALWGPSTGRGHSGFLWALSKGDSSSGWAASG